MQAGGKKGGKKATKLSLIKKAQKAETLPIKQTDGIKNILQGKVDLNETCEFQQPLKSHGRGDCKAKTGKDGKTTATAVTSKDAEACSSGVSADETICCQVCKKNIGHMNLQCREQHVNRCIDKVEATEKQQKEEERLLETARTAVLDCPMCGKHFKSENARLVHLKKCSVNVGVSTEKMLQLVKDQEKMRQEQIEAGIVPRELRSKVSKTVASKKRKLKEPKSQFEEDVQVAMAMSSSLASEQNVMDGETAGDSVTDTRRKKAKKAVLEDVCLLTTLSDEDRKRRMEEKVSGILHMAFSVNHTNDSTLHDSRFKSGSQQNGHSLWKLCSQDPVALETEEFYVGELVPPLSVSQTEPGKRLRRLSSIPGREKSFVRKTDNIQEKISAGTPNMSAEDIITASTQTAVVLAELAVDDTDIHDSLVGLQLPQSPETEADLQASGFCVEKMVLNKSDQDVLVSETLADFKKMINNKDYSDVTVVSCGQEFSAHKVVLAARCPKLLQMMKESTIALEVPPDIVLMFLNYIYTGDVTLTSSAQSELLKLASDLELPSLADACNKAVLHTETSETFAAHENLEASNTEFVESQLDMKEVWGESDSDLDSDKGDQSGDKESQTDSEINDAEYREICCTQKTKLINRISQKSDNSEVSDERNLISENVSECSDGALSCNEMCNVLKINTLNETGSETEQLVNANSPGKEKDAVSDAYSTDSRESNFYEVVDVDTDEEPKQKRIRLGSEHQFDKTIKDNSDSQKVSNNTLNKVITDINVDSTSSKLSYEYENERASNDEENVDTSNTGFNSSTADLFGSPTPKKSTVTLTEGKKFNSPHGNSKVSLPVENKSNSRRTLHTSVIPVIDIDSDSSFEDIADSKETADKNQEARAPDSHDESYMYTKVSLLNGDVSESFQEIREIGEKELDRDENVSCAQQNKSSSCADSSDDDLQITGDNFDDLSQHSPTFNQAKCESRMQKLYAVSRKINATKYLGLKSMTEGISDESQLQSSGSNCIGNGSVCRDDCLSKNKEMNSMDTEDNNFCDMKSPKPFKVKHFKDKVSDSDEIVTIETEDSDACDDQDLVPEMNRASPDDDLLSDVKLGDTDEPNIEKSPVRDKRKSAFYGRHEISVYSGAGDNTVACSPNQSFEENKSDIWDDFDDCGMAYEPPCGSPGETSPLIVHDQMEQNLRETSPVIGYQEQVEYPGQVSPIIPEQDEVIDLSQNEDDNNMHNEPELDSNLLEDGDDSFVFKVDDQPDVSDKLSGLSSGNKGSAFKTPSISEGRGKKRSAWVPPSPFTPMPQYGEMPTPALKKAVQKFGVKPVSKKRMVKVLEDIYHQTHQYETDSECEGEDQVKGKLGSGQMEDIAASSDQLTSSQGDMSSQDSDISDVLEESFLHMSSDSDTPASPQKNIDLTKKLFDFVKSRPDIHRRILMYEPLELDVLKSDVKEACIKCSMDKLMDFLDERCIAFTSKNSRKRQTGTRGRQKKTKSKQTKS